MPNTDAARIVELLVNQVTQPVRWIDCVNRMVEAGATEIVEIGFGQTLSQLIRYINSEVSVLSIGTEEELRATCTSSSEGEAQTESQFDDGRKVMADGRIVWPDGMTWDPNEPGAHGF
jgi:acyl transferase domain-containing protein